MFGKQSRSLGTIPRSNALTESGRTQIHAYKDCGLSHKQVALNLVDQDLIVLNNYVSLKDKYGTCIQSGWKSTIAESDKRDTW